MPASLRVASLLALTALAASAQAQASTVASSAAARQSGLLVRVMDAQQQRVAEAQRRLSALGLYRGTTNGTLGPKTRSALAAYQGKVGLPATGQLDDATLYALQNNELLGVCAAHGVNARDCFGAIEQFQGILAGHGEARPSEQDDVLAKDACAGVAAQPDCESAVAKMSAWLSTRSTSPK